MVSCGTWWWEYLEGLACKLTWSMSSLVTEAVSIIIIGSFWASSTPAVLASPSCRDQGSSSKTTPSRISLKSRADEFLLSLKVRSFSSEMCDESVWSSEHGRKVTWGNYNVHTTFIIIIIRLINLKHGIKVIYQCSFTVPCCLYLLSLQKRTQIYNSREVTYAPPVRNTKSSSLRYS